MGGRREDAAEPGVRDDDTVVTNVRERTGSQETGGGAENEASNETVRLDRERMASANARGNDRPDGEGHASPTVGWVDESAMRLLGAFHDLSEADPEKEIPVGEPGPPERRGAAQEAGLDVDSVGGTVERDVAARYLLNQGYVEKPDGTGPNQYRITPAGIEQVRRMRGLFVEPTEEQGEGSKMSEKMQTRLLSVLTIVLFIVLNGRVKKFIDKQVPERRGIRDDLLEASLQGVARLAAVFGASLVVKRLIGSRD